MRIGISVEKAFNIFSLFDDDRNGSLDCTEFLRHVFPEEYVKNQQERLRCINIDIGYSSWVEACPVS